MELAGLLDALDIIDVYDHRDEKNQQGEPSNDPPVSHENVNVTKKRSYYRSKQVKSNADRKPSNTINGGTLKAVNLSRLTEVLYSYGEIMFSERPRLSKYRSSDFYQDCFYILKRFNIKPRKGRKTRNVAFFTVYLASKHREMGVDPILLASSIGLSYKDPSLAVNELVPPVTDTDPGIMELIDLIYKTEDDYIDEDYYERMFLTMHKILIGCPPGTTKREIFQKMGLEGMSRNQEVVDQFVEYILFLFRELTWEKWNYEMKNFMDKVRENFQHTLHTISPQKLAVFAMFSYILEKSLQETQLTSHVVSRCLQKMFTKIFDYLANNLDKTKKILNGQ